jgi:hypothetical protein
MGMALLLCTGSLMQGYAVVHGSDSALPAVDIYTYEAKDAKDAVRQHQNYARALSVPETTVNVLDKIKGVSMPVGAALSGATEGVSLAVAQGFGTAVDALKMANNLFGSHIKEGIARAFRGDTAAYHSDVPRGNSGRFAEWKTDKDIYIIVTLPKSLIPLHEGAISGNVGSRQVKSGLSGKMITLPGRVTAFSVQTSPDPNKPGNQIYKAVFGNTYVREYVPADVDERSYKNNKAEMLKRAKVSGYSALEQPVPKG